MVTERELPEFGKPPVVETVLSASFRELPGFGTAGVIDLWASQLRSDYPNVEERPRYAVPIERFGPSGGGVINFEFGSTGLPSPRYWFVDESGAHLVQLQTDWIAHNWRKTPDRQVYERYPAGRDRFAGLLRNLEHYLLTSGAGPLVPLQCEVTYVNHIEVDPADGLAHGVLRDLDVGRRPAGLLADPETVALTQSYVIPVDGDPVGRLHVDVGVVPSAEGPVLAINLTARGRPLGPGIDGVLEFCDLGRRWIVEGFAELTTKTMHDRWERIR